MGCKLAWEHFSGQLLPPVIVRVYLSHMEVRFYDYVHRQIVPLILLSVFPGLGYLFLGWRGGVVWPAAAWYLGILLVSGWGILLHRAYLRRSLAQWEKERWYRRVLAFYLNP